MTQKIFLFLILCIALSCTKESDTFIENNEELPGIDAVPEISLVQISSNAVKAYEDSLAFTISYIDGNGDLGTDDPDIPSIELVDTRNPDLLKFEYHLSPRAPEGSNIAIQGELTIVLNHTILLDENNNSEETTFKIRLKDMAGNWSNEVETETITVSQ